MVRRIKHCLLFFWERIAFFIGRYGIFIFAFVMDCSIFSNHLPKKEAAYKALVGVVVGPSGPYCTGDYEFFTHSLGPVWLPPMTTARSLGRLMSASFFRMNYRSLTGRFRANYHFA